MAARKTFREIIFNWYIISMVAMFYFFMATLVKKQYIAVCVCVCVLQ